VSPLGDTLGGDAANLNRGGENFKLALGKLATPALAGTA